MLRTIFRHPFILPATMALALFLTGCSGADNPKIADVPQIKIPEKVEAPKIPGKKTEYGANSKYQEIMERQAKQQGGR